MKQFYLLVLMIGCAGVSVAQTFQYQVRVDEFYSGAPHQHTWKIQTRVGGQTNHSTINECWGIDDTNNNRWFSGGVYNYSVNSYYNGDPNASNRMIRSGVTSLGTLFRFVFDGYEHDEYSRCAEADSYNCGWTSWDDGNYRFVFNYDNLGGVAPGGWKQVEYAFCDGFYGLRLSYNLLPPKINSVLLSKNGSTAETNYCQGQDIVLKVTDNGPGVIEHNDIEYVWQYNIDDEGYEDPYSCNQWDYSNCGWEITDDCMICIERPWIATWRDAVVSNSKTASFALPYTGSYKFRVIMRNKTTGKIGYDYSTPTPAVFVYSPPPVLSGLPSDGDLVLDNVSEKDYTGTSIDITHVACRGASTGTLSIKKIIGYGSYYYTLKKSDGTLTLNANGYTVGTPSAADPVVFPRDAFNKGTLTGLPAGQYTLYIENLDDPNGTGDDQRLCFNEYPIYIKQPAADVGVSFSPVEKGGGNPYPISCYGASDGTVSATGSGGVGPYTYSLTGFDSQNNSGTVNFIGLSAADSYTLTASDAFFCPSAGKTIEDLAQPKALSIGSPAYEYYGDLNQYNISCNGQTGQVTLYTSGDGAMERTMQVTGGPSDSDVVNDSDPVIFALGAGTYSVVASYETGGCVTDPVSVTLAEPSALQAIVQNTQPASCLPGKGTNDRDGYITLTVSGGIPKVSDAYTSYLTISPQTTVNGTQPTFNGLSSNTYDVMIQDKHCSHPVAGLVVPVNPNPVRFKGLAQITDPSCNEYDNGKITVTGRGGFPFSTSLYEFSIEDIKKSGQYASTTFDYGITRGAYKLTIGDSKGCWSDTTVVVSEPLPLTGLLTLTPNTCRGDEVAQIAAALSGGTGPYSIQWLAEGNQVLMEDTVSSSSIMPGLAAGTYTLRLKDSRGCTNNEPTWYELPQTITDPEVLTLSVFSFEHISCYEANDGYVSLAANGGWTSSYSYSSDNISFKTPAEFTGLMPGSHTFYVRDARGCSVSVLHEVEEPAVLTASLQGVKDAQCFASSNGSVQLTIGGGTTPYYVTAGGQPWTEGNEVAGLKANTYTVSVRDENGCPQSVVATVKQPELLVLSQVGETLSSTCGTANGGGTVSAGGGIRPFEYRWYNSGGTLSASDSAAVDMLSGIYRVEVEDHNHCVTPPSVAISDVGGAKIDAWDITGATCSYSLDGAVDITITEGTAPFLITWTNGKDTEDITALPTGDYQVRVEDSNHCQLFKTFTVPAPLPLDVTIVDSKPPTCFGDSDAFVEVAFAGGNGGYNYNWASGASGTRLEDLRAGDYSIALTDSKGCEYEEVITLADPDKLLLGLVDKTICVGQVHHIMLPVEGVYQWTSTTGFTSDQREVSLTDGGTYAVHVVDVKGCIADESFALTTSTDLLRAELLIARKAYAGDTVVVIDISWPLPDGITWQFDVVNTQIISQDQNMAQMIFPQPGVYPVGVEVALGDCRDTDTQFITILEEEENPGGRVNTEPLVKRFDIYPNPNGGNFMINIVLRDPVPARVRMVNLSGNKNLIDHRVETQEYEYQALLEGIPAGIYYIVLDVSGETKTKRVVIK